MVPTVMECRELVTAEEVYQSSIPLIIVLNRPSQLLQPQEIPRYLALLLMACKPKASEVFILEDRDPQLLSVLQNYSDRFFLQGFEPDYALCDEDGVAQLKFSINANGKITVT